MPASNKYKTLHKYQLSKSITAMASLKIMHIAEA